MSFTNDSERLIKFLMKNFDSFRSRCNSGLRLSIRRFYSDIEEAHNNMLDAYNGIDKKVSECVNYDISRDPLLNSMYVAAEMKQYIADNATTEIKYSCNIHDRQIEIIFYMMNGEEPEGVDTLLKRMVTWLYFIIPYASRECVKKLTVRCYRCEQVKMLPISEDDIISPINVNSGVANVCLTSGDICVYRSEEMFKVFLHETFHALGLDWISMGDTIVPVKLKELFPISSDMRVCETYTEFWGNMFNCMFTAFYLTDNKTSFTLYSEYCIYFEQVFVVLQCAKILKFMGLKYSDLYENGEIGDRYRENSNIFTYFILKMILMLNAGSFMSHCRLNNSNTLNFNKTQHNLSKFYNFIEKRYKQRQIVSKVNKMQLILDSCHPDTFIKGTLRMTAIELN